MKFMKRFCGLLAVVAMMGTLSGLTGCSDSAQNDSVEVSTTAANENVDEDRMSETEAQSRARDAIKEKFDSIPAYNVRLPDSSCTFSRFGGITGDADVDFVESSNTYFVTITDGTCGIRHTFMGAELFGRFEAQFSATVKVYSNGDASVDTFNYEIVESK
ncbi:MAG: hypothetical protein ACI4TG_05040 [Ruminococcus sp.]